MAVMATIEEVVAAHRPASRLMWTWSVRSAERILEEDVLDGRTLVRLISALARILRGGGQWRFAVPLRRVK
jgi:hypothetical protein